jgi:hypothetical protein
MSFALKKGLMKLRKGFTPVPGKDKTGSGQHYLSTSIRFPGMGCVGEEIRLFWKE